MLYAQELVVSVVRGKKPAYSFFAIAVVRRVKVKVGLRGDRKRERERRGIGEGGY